MTYSSSHNRMKTGNQFRQESAVIKRLTFFCWLALCLLFSLSAAGDDETLNFYHYTNEDGLPSSYVKSIAQDADGFIWLATRISISRFDGKNFREFPVFDKSGKKINRINFPERPISIVFGGKDKNVLFVTAHSSLYSVKIK